MCRSRGSSRTGHPDRTRQDFKAGPSNFPGEETAYQFQSRRRSPGTGTDLRTVNRADTSCLARQTQIAANSPLPGCWGDGLRAPTLECKQLPKNHGAANFWKTEFCGWEAARSVLGKFYQRSSIEAREFSVRVNTEIPWSPANAARVPLGCPPWNRTRNPGLCFVKAHFRIAKIAVSVSGFPIRPR